MRNFELHQNKGRCFVLIKLFEAPQHFFFSADRSKAIFSEFIHGFINCTASLLPLMPREGYAS